MLHHLVFNSYRTVTVTPLHFAYDLLSQNRWIPGQQARASGNVHDPATQSKQDGPHARIGISYAHRFSCLVARHQTATTSRAAGQQSFCRPDESMQSE